MFQNGLPQIQVKRPWFQGKPSQLHGKPPRVMVEPAHLLSPGHRNFRSIYFYYLQGRKMIGLQFLMSAYADKESPKWKRWLRRNGGGLDSCTPSWAQSAMDQWIDTDSINGHYQSMLSVSFSSMLWIHQLKIFILINSINNRSQNLYLTNGYQSISTHSIDSIDPSIKPTV